MEGGVQPSVAHTDMGNSDRYSSDNLGTDSDGDEAIMDGFGDEQSSESDSDTDGTNDESNDSAEEMPVGECDNGHLYAQELVSFEPGEGAGYGQDKLPNVVLGPPQIGEPISGSTDVLSLGVGGEIVLAFVDVTIVDGPGDDFVVWENPFWINGDETQPFYEMGRVSVSQDGENWFAFDCEPGPGGALDEQCAGWRPRLSFDPCAESLDAIETGGDGFDLNEIGVEAVQFIKITDMALRGSAPSAGFDLDAVGAVNFERQ